MRTKSFLLAVLIAIASAVAVPAAGAPARVVDAVRDGDSAALRALLKQHADVNLAETDGTTALAWAARQGDAATVDLLLRAGADAKKANRYGISPLSLAAEAGDTAILLRLLNAGADANTTVADGETALMLAARAGKADAIKLLASRGANVNAKENRMGETPLIWAAAENNAEAVRMLVEFGAGADTRSARVQYPPQVPADPSNYVSSAAPKGEWTPLMYTAREGALEAARALIDLGANVNVQDPDGMTPLLEAIVNMHLDFAAALLDKGADPNLADVSGMTALYAAIDMHTPAWERSRPDPKENDKLDCLALMKVLLDHGANVNAALKGRILQRYHAGGSAVLGEGTTPLIRAARYDNLDMIRLLVERGADVKLAQKDGTTALMLASGVKYSLTQEGDPVNAGSAADAYEIVKLLIEKGSDVNAVNAKGETALYGAAFVGRNQAIAYLAEHGARLDAKTKQGLTILDGALNTGVADDGTGARVGGKPGESTVSLVRQLMLKAGVQPAVANTPTPLLAMPVRQGQPQTVAPGR
jgi:ankyrin repeat protein